MMTKEERERECLSSIDAMIDRYDMERRCDMSRDAIRRHVRRGMLQNNFAFICADMANTFLLDCEQELKPFGVGFGHKDKYNFNQMLNHITAAKKWAKMSALPIYGIDECDDACADSDWWYNMLKLIDDRTGDDPRKTHMLLEWLLSMPSEVGLFNIKYEDFKQFKPDGR